MLDFRTAVKDARMPDLLDTPTIRVTDMHTGGEPVRIVTAGYPAIKGGNILEKRAWARDNLDHLRKLIIFEPRGHFDMYGVIPVEPSLPDKASEPRRWRSILTVLASALLFYGVGWLIWAGIREHRQD